MDGAVESAASETGKGEFAVTEVQPEGWGTKWTGGCIQQAGNEQVRNNSSTAQGPFLR